MKAKPSEKSPKKAFTLIELLIVVAIIGVLAAMLMPSLGGAKRAAQGAACLSNLKGIGSAVMLYTNDYRGLFPTAYSYVNGSGSSGGYMQWSAAVENYSDYKGAVDSGTYPKYANRWICPSHPVGGWAPSNFTPGRIPNPPAGQVAQSATIDDRQVPRISYVANEAIMPRKKYDAAHDTNKALCLVNTDEIQSSTNTILVGEFSDSPNCIWGTSQGGGATYKSHRPTNGVKYNDGTLFDGEAYVQLSKTVGADPNLQPGKKIAKLTADEAQKAIDDVLAGTDATTVHHISYINPAAHGGGSNYLFADGHADKFTLAETLDPSNYMWGRKMYSCVDKPAIVDANQ